MRWGSCEYVLHRYSLFFVTIVLRRDWFWCDKESVGYFFDDDVKDTEFYDGNKKRQPRSNGMVVLLVRVKGLEPLRRKTPDPKSGASAIPPHSQVPVHFITFFGCRSTENCLFRRYSCKNSQYLKNLLSRPAQCAILRMTQRQVLL